MARVYCAFLIRCWQLDQDAQRIEIAHIQTGERVLADSPAVALDWIARRSAVASHPSASPADQPAGAAGGGGQATALPAAEAN